MQSDCQSTHVGWALLAVTLLWEGQHLAVAEHCVTYSGCRPVLINLLNGYHLWHEDSDRCILLADGISGTECPLTECWWEVYLLLVCSVEINMQISSSFNQVWNWQIPICVWGECKKQRFRQIICDFLPKYIPTNALLCFNMLPFVHTSPRSPPLLQHQKGNYICEMEDIFRRINLPASLWP